jgi:O-antigen/teichoic acid export membrane protein
MNPETESPTFVVPEEAQAVHRPLTGGAVMSGASRITVAVSGAATTIFVARLLGPSGAGSYALAQSFIVLLTVASTLGIEHGIAYYVSSGRWSASGAYRNAQWVALVSGLAGATLGLSARVAVPSAFGGLSVGTTAVAAFALPFALSWFYLTYIALAIDHYESYVLPPAVQSVLGLIFVSVLAALYGLPGAVAGFTLAHVVTAIAAGFTARKVLMFGTSRPQPGEAQAPLRRAIGFGVKGYAANALQLINYRLDLFILASVATAADVGHYSVAIAVTSVMWLLPQALSDVLFPRVAALSARSSDEGGLVRAFVETKSMRHTALIVVVSTVALALALDFLVVPVYGVAFRPAVDLGLILLPGVALLGLSGTMSSTIVGRGHPGYSLTSALIVTPVTVALYVALIPTLHATGAALASSISYACSFLLVAVFYGRAIGEPVIPRLIPTRSEIADYRALAPAILEWTGNLRGRHGG